MTDISKVTGHAIFRGCFKEVVKRSPDGTLDLNGFILLPAPNRFRKLLKAPQGLDGSTIAKSFGTFDEDAFMNLQKADYPDRKNPCPPQFDLFDVYLAWRGVSA